MNELIQQDIFPLKKIDLKTINSENSVIFIGSPMQHPHEKDKFILIPDPLSDYAIFYEFSKQDVLYFEEIPALISSTGENILMAKVWIKKGVIAFKIEPFIVSKTTEVIKKLKK